MLVDTAHAFRSELSQPGELVSAGKFTFKGKKVIPPCRDLPVLQIHLPVLPKFRALRKGEVPTPSKIIPKGKVEKRQVNILLDTGSSVNLVSEECANFLNLYVYAKDKQMKISTVNGICVSKSNEVLIDFVPPRRSGEKIPPFTLWAYTHQTLGCIPNATYPIMPTFANMTTAMEQYEMLNGIYPRKNEPLHMIISQQDLTRFLWEGMRVYSLSHPNKYSITNFSKSGEGYACWDTHWGTIWSGGGPRNCIQATCPGIGTKDNNISSVTPKAVVVEEPTLPTSQETQDDLEDLELHEAKYTTEDLVIAFKRMVDLDRLPLRREEKPYTEEELKAIRKIDQVMYLDPIKKRMHTRLLLKDELNIKNNYFIVKNRMESLYRSFKMHPTKNARKKEEYKKNWAMFQEYGVLKRYEDDTPWLDDTGPKNYLATTVVVKLNSLTTPYRTCVCGDTQTGTGLSLNDNILDTPSLHMKIADIEARSRLGKYLLIADIKKLFLHMYIDSEEDRRLLRVLYKDPDGPEDAPWEVWAYCAAIYGLKDSPFQLGTALHKCCNYWKQMTDRSDFELSVASRFVRSTYVDDLTICFNSLESTKKAVKICAEIAAVGGFHFRKWLSNSSEVLESIPEAERAPHSIVIEHERGQELERYVSSPTLQLGYRYNAASDEFVMDRFGQIAFNRETQTKRGVASCLASVYDPLKLLGPFLLTAKRVMKLTHKYKLDWKDNIDKLLTHEEVVQDGQQEHVQNMLSLWQEWLAQLSELEGVTFPRYIPNNRESKYIVASDASMVGMCACIHIVTTENGYTSSHLLASLCNITPLKTKMEKPLTIPLLELKAIDFSCDLGIWLMDELDVQHDQIIFVSDSRTAICWTLKRVETLISNVARIVKKLHERRFSINFVPGEQNQAADRGSRGATVAEVNDTIWRHGPSWYKLPVSQHPYQQVESTQDKYGLVDLGLKKRYSVLEPDRGVNIDGPTEEIKSIFRQADNTVFTVNFGVTAHFSELVYADKYKSENRRGKKRKLGPLQRQVLKRMKLTAASSTKSDTHHVHTIAEPTTYKGIRCVLPSLSYFGVTDWGYSKLLRQAALVFCAVQSFKQKNSLGRRKTLHARLFSSPHYSSSILQQHCRKNFPELSDEMTLQAHYYYVLLSQWTHFQEEMIDLHKPEVNGQPSQVKLRSPLAKYSPQLRMSGVGTLKMMCITGRLDDDNLALDTKHPPILSKKSRFAVLFIRHIHTQVFVHSNSLQTYNHMKRYIFIPAGLQLVKKTLRLCVLCKKLSSKRLEQLMGNLPKPFLTGTEGHVPKRFEYTACDYTGAISVYPHGARNKCTYKAYLAVFYCLYTKAYFITPVPCNDTGSFLTAFEKLAVTFGRPTHLYSDNQPAFVKGSSVIQERISYINEHIKSLHKNQQFEWSFGLPHDPQALWERAIAETKKTLYKVFKQPNLDTAKPVLNYHQLDLVCRRIMFSLNERPLQPLLSSPDSFEMVTPHRLIFGEDLSALLLSLSDTTIPFNSEVQRSMLKRVDAMIRQFNNIYQRNYIVEAKNRNYWKRKQPNVQVGDLLLIESHGTRKYEKRARWNAGRVVSVIKGRDDLIRRVELREVDGKVRVHPIHDLFPLIDARTRKAADEIQKTT